MEGARWVDCACERRFGGWGWGGPRTFFEVTPRSAPLAAATTRGRSVVSSARRDGVNCDPRDPIRAVAAIRRAPSKRASPRRAPRRPVQRATRHGTPRRLLVGGSCSVRRRYLSVVGSGHLFMWSLLLIQISIPTILIAETYRNYMSSETERIPNPLTVGLHVHLETHARTRMMLFAILALYLIKAKP